MQAHDRFTPDRRANPFLALPPMGLTWPVLAAVLLGALLHASWNARVKASPDKELDTALIHILGSALTLPAVLLLGLPDRACWPYLAASMTIHVAYYLALTGAYRHGDLGLTYPLMRGVAPVLVALGTQWTLGEPLSSAAWTGVLGVSAGVLILGLHPAALEHNPRAVALALANAVVIAAYTVVDGLGVRASGDAARYVSLLFLLDGWPFGLLVLRRRGLAVSLAYARTRWRIAALAACASLGSYGIALWAMTRAPVALIAALRETSVLFAVIMGSWLLHEPFTMRRGVGAVCIVAGVMALRLA
jgi:phosphonate utilization associated putative membrane protein